MATKKQARNVEVKVKTIQKRDGTFVPFDISKIATAINKSMIATGEGSPKEAELVANKVYADVLRITRKYKNFIPTVDGYIGFMKENLGNKLKESEYKEIREGILKQEAMPSMRLLQFACKAARATNVCAYNCSYIAPENFQDMAEIMYVSMCGTGAGWSVESQNVQKFPQIMMQTGEKLPTHVISDD